MVCSFLIVVILSGLEPQRDRPIEALTAELAD